MSDLPEAYITHVSHGRVRVKIPTMKHDPDYFFRLKNYLSPLPGVEKVEVNPLTGSVLILHTLDLECLEGLKSMAGCSEMSGLFKLTVPESANFLTNPGDSNSVSIAESLAVGFACLNENVKKLTGGIVDIPTLVVIVLLAVGVMQISEGVVVVPAITALWYAGSILKDQLSNEKREMLGSKA